MKIFKLDLKKIKKRREELGMSLQELGRRTRAIDKKGLGISGASCGRIESGISSPVTDSLLLILPALSLRPDECYVEVGAEEVIHVDLCDSCCYDIEDCAATGVVFDEDGGGVNECDKYEEF